MLADGLEGQMCCSEQFWQFLLRADVSETIRLARGHERYATPTLVVATAGVGPWQDLARQSDPRITESLVSETRREAKNDSDTPVETKRLRRGAPSLGSIRSRRWSRATEEGASCPGAVAALSTRAAAARWCLSSLLTAMAEAKVDKASPTAAGLEDPLRFLAERYYNGATRGSSPRSG